MSSDEDPNITRTIIPSDFDIPAEIEPPDISSNS